MRSKKEYGQVGLPPGHCTATLGEVAGEAVSQTGPAGTFIYLDIGAVDRESKTFVEPKLLNPAEAPSRAKQVVHTGDVMVSMTRPNLNAIAMVPEGRGETVASTGFHVLRSAWIDPKFLYYLVQTDVFIDAMSAVVQGALYPAVRPKDISGFQFNLPPRAEQTRIVEKLEELLSDLDASVAELKAAQRKLAQYRQSLLKAAVEGALTADWRAARTQNGKPSRSSSPRKRGSSDLDSETSKTLASRFRGNDGKSETGPELLQRILSERRARWEQKQLTKFAEQGKTPPKDWRAKYPEPVAPYTVGLPTFPDGWVWASVDQCATDEDGITDGPFGSNLKSSHYTETGPRVLRLQNIGDGRFVNAQAHISQEHYESLRKHAVAKGDVVAAMLGEALPRACVVPSGVEPAIVKADCARIRINAELLAPELMNAFLNSEPTRKRVAGLVKGIGRPRVNLGNLRGISVPIPPRAEQAEIQASLARSIEACEQQNAALERGFVLAAAQRKNILKAAFGGQLVPQDPNDEPASALLARIRAARAEAGTTTARKPGHKAKETA